MILDIYKDSFEFSSKKFPVLLVMGVLSFFSFLIIPAIVVFGYNYKVVKISTESMINGGDVPPEFNDFKSLFVNGLKYIIVQIVYAIIPIIIFSLSSMAGNYAGLVILIAIVLLFLAEACVFIAIPHMAANDDSLKAAFDIKELISIIESIGTLRFLLTYLGILIIVAVVSLAIVGIMILLFMILGIAISPISVEGFSIVSVIIFLAMDFVILFIVSPYLSLFQDRCSGLIYNIRG